MDPISVIMPTDGETNCAPTYLFDYKSLYKENALDSGLHWFRDATYGLGVDFGLHSLLGRGENALSEGVVTPAEYRCLVKKLEAPHFDAVDIVELAIANGMRYITFSVRTADGFSMYNSQLTEFNCARTPARRDFLGELASMCEYHGLGLCIRYSHGRDWSRPEGEPGKQGQPEMGRLLEYQNFMLGQIKELLTQYGPIAGVCLEGIDVPQGSSALEEYGCQDLYDFIHHLQPQTLVAYEQGLLGTEDFFSCVDELPTAESDALVRGHMLRQLGKHREVRFGLTRGTRGYHADQAGHHVREEALWDKFGQVRRGGANLLVHTALMPDGSLDLEDIDTLLAIGSRIESGGYPA